MIIFLNLFDNLGFPPLSTCPIAKNSLFSFFSFSLIFFNKTADATIIEVKQ